MEIAAFVALMLSIAVLGVVTWFRVSTRTPAARAPGATTPPEGIDPLDAGLLLNLPRRAFAAAVLGQIRLGRVDVDPESGISPFRFLLREPESRGDVIEVLFGSGRDRRERTDLRKPDAERKDAVRDAIGWRARGLRRYRGLLRSSWLRETLSKIIWGAMPVVGAMALASLVDGSTHSPVGAMLAVPGLVMVVGATVVRRGIGWRRTERGQRIAEELLGFQASLRADPALRASWPDWALLLADEAESMVAPGGAQLDAAWIRGMAERLDPGPDPDLSARHGAGDISGGS